MNIEKRISQSIGSQWHFFLGAVAPIVFISGLGRNVECWRHFGQTGEPFFRLYYPLRGEFHVVFPDAEYPVSPGHLVLIPPLTTFTFRSVEPCTHYWLHFMSAELQKLPAVKRPFSVPVLPEKDPEIRRRFRHIYRMSKSDISVGESLEIQTETMRILQPLLESALKDVAPEILQPGQFDRIPEYVDSRLAQPINVEELRKLTTYGRAEFSARFRECFGIPPKQYIVARRIALAQRLLLESHLTVKEIALRCGYENEFFFYRIFRKYSSFSPRWYGKKSNISKASR